MKLAKKGNAEAEFKVGEMYETGFGVEKNLAEAKKWINKAAAQGHETANFKLLYWDIQDNGLKGDNKDKLNELKSKASNGNSQAMYYVGKMHAYGVGMKKDYTQSLDWLNKAALDGVLEAEREAIVVKELQQKAVAQSRKAEEERKAKEKAQQEAERKKAEAEKAEQDRLKAEAEKKRLEAQKQKQMKERMQAQQDKKADEEARRAQAEAVKREEAELERRRQALIKKKEELKRKKEKEAQFEADPCKGKSARFLSTCR